VDGRAGGGRAMGNKPGGKAAMGGRAMGNKPGGNAAMGGRARGNKLRARRLWAINPGEGGYGR
jgi:hypothetical protein